MDNTGVITAFKILSESGVAAGVRRIEAITAEGVFEHYRRIENELNAAAKAVKAEPAGLARKVEALLEEIKELHSENEKLKAKLANNSLGDVMNQVKELGGMKVLAAKVPDVDMNGLRNLGDQLKEKLGEGVVFLASSQAACAPSFIAPSVAIATRFTFPPWLDARKTTPSPSAIVNAKIAERIPVVTQVLAIEEAKKTGAKALFATHRCIERCFIHNNCSVPASAKFCYNLGFICYNGNF